MAAEALEAVVLIEDWSGDEDFDIHPYGSKAKRTIICPAEQAPGLIRGHRYLFKRAEGWKGQQMWSEAIAYQIGAMSGLDVPRCYVAYDGRREECGALIEFFYRYPGRQDDRELKHGADLLQGAGLMDPGGQPHLVTANIDYCRGAGIAHAELWWARALAFDALIGNVDRHAENWGFLVGEDRVPVMTPVFDNGTSLGYEVRDDDIAARLGALEPYLVKGRHRCGWDVDYPASGRHVDLCRKLAQTHPATRDVMVHTVNIDVDELRQLGETWVDLEVEPRFSEARLNFVATLVERRRSMLLEALEA